MSQTLDRAAIYNLIALILNYIGYNFYLYELFWGGWDKVTTKSFFYLITGAVLLWFTIGEWKGWNTVQQLHTSVVYKLTLVITFWSFFLILRGVNGLFYLITYDISILIISVIILFSGLRYDYFFKE